MHNTGSARPPKATPLGREKQMPEGAARHQQPLPHLCVPSSPCNHRCGRWHLAITYVGSLHNFECSLDCDGVSPVDGVDTKK